jgi:hypothetical protein
MNMGLMLGDLYCALVSRGVDPDLARAAAEETYLACRERWRAKIKTEGFARLHSALREAGVNEESARQVVEEAVQVAKCGWPGDAEASDMRVGTNPLIWMVGINIGLTIIALGLVL